MGLIKAAGAAANIVADQWKEYFYCDSLESDVLIKKGHKRTSARSSNKKGSDNIISNGSVIAVADGQCMLIVEQGKIVEVSAVPGEFVYDTSTEPSIFQGPLSDSIFQSFSTFGRRFTFGGDTAKDQRVYYINIKELLDNKFGTPNPIPFRVVDKNLGLDIDVSVRCSGVYSYKISDPIKFYKSITGNMEEEYLRDQITPQLKPEFISALQPAFAQLSAMEIRPNQMIAHTAELEEALNQILSTKWGELRGLDVVSVALSSVTLPEEDANMLKEAQRIAILRSPDMAAATLAGAQAEAMKSAAKNEAGALNGFLGMGMAMNAGGANIGNLFAQAAQNKQNAPNPFVAPINQNPAPAPAPSAPSDGWKCSCGHTNSGKFCENCGSPKPSDNSWKCSCGNVNTGNFCSQCGQKKPVNAVYKCSNCGWQPEDPHNPPKFCPQCGDKFDDGDKQ